MNQEDRDAALNTINPQEIDTDFLPYLERINRLPYVATQQCCVGHMPYPPEVGDPADSSARWGYLQLLLDAEVAEWLNERVTTCEWIVIELSQLWPVYVRDQGPGQVPGITENGSIALTVAWDALSWPAPAEEVCEMLEEYEENCINDSDDDL